MSDASTIEKVRETMLDVFDLDDLDITTATTAGDIEEWDSLSHVRLIVAIERAFGIRFASSEIEKLSNVGDLVNMIETKAG